jgi:hypothetical protein
MRSKSAEYFVLAMALAMLAVPDCVTAESPGLEEKQRAPLQLPFGVDPSARSLESNQRLRDELRDQDLRVDPDANRRMFRPKQPEPGYSEVRPYPGADIPNRVRPLTPIP